MTQPSENTRSYRDRIGVSIASPSAPTLIATIEEAEQAGVATIWMTQSPATVDSLTVFGAAFGRTERIHLGTSIVPTYPRHPLALAQQAATVDALGAGRLRLGVGPSHRPVIESTYGITMDEPLEHLREYVGVLRAALWEGKVEHEGRFLTARTNVGQTHDVPIMISALGPGAFRLAGAIADGAISWNCPVSYLLDTALPALREGATEAGRATPTLVAHAWVALSTDANAVRESARKRIGFYGRLPFYANMFAAAGFPVGEGGTINDALIDNLVVQGDDAAVSARLKEMLDSGLDELLLTVVPVGDEAADRSRLFGLLGGL